MPDLLNLWMSVLFLATHEKQEKLKHVQKINVEAQGSMDS
jgi:hypothetical protein